jgi:hypothetical protein
MRRGAGCPRGHPGRPGGLAIPKDQILDLLRQQGKDDQVGEADQQLPDQVDPEQHAGLLQKFGLDPAELLQKFAGGALGGKIPGL